ncbi:MAG: P-loop NTPase [Bacteroidetes bacterium]|nr:P-loop NTPase [Bacteroidota bacterium]
MPMHSDVIVHDQATRLRELVYRSTQSTQYVKPKMIAIASGKGGVGKSIISLNLSLAFAEAGKRVLLVDADHNLGNLATLLGVVPKYSIADVLRGEREIEEILLRPYDRLNFLAGSSGECDYPFATEKDSHAFSRLIQSLDFPQDYIIVDLSAGITPNILSLCSDSDETLVVTTDEPTAVMDAYALIKMLLLANSQQAINVIVNNVPTIQVADETYKKLALAVQKFLRRSIGYYGGIPSDVHLQKSIYLQKPVFYLAPHSAATLSIRACSQRIMEQQPINRKEPVA